MRPKPNAMMRPPQIFALAAPAVAVAPMSSEVTLVPTISWPVSASIRTTIRKVTMVEMINMRPPMVGVPCFCLCQFGPMSRMVWPNFSLWSQGTILSPAVR